VTDRTPVRAAFLLGASALAACDNWPVQKDGGTGGGDVPAPRDAASTCTTLVPIQASTSPQVNGGLCFGVAHGSSDTLQCGPSSTGNVTQCVDTFLNGAFLVRWSGNEATVVTAFDGRALGAVQLVNNSTFEVSITGGSVGTCRFVSGPPQGIELCTE